ncbi:MAG: hypothetical protein E7339_00150 [Clostridiales bacterium]|nr:hypothetical protein [Clostridiales bacterium]
MTPLILTLLIINAIVAIVFTITSYKKTLLNLYLKTIASTLFVLLGIASLFYTSSLLLGKEILSKHIVNELIGGFLILTALIFCLIGDIILGMPRISELKRDRLPVIVGGAGWFLIGHAIYCVALASIFEISLWVIAIIIPLSLFYTFANKLFGKLDYKKLTIGVFLYSLVESLSLALCILALINRFSVSALLLTIGFTLFYFSDMVLMHNYFGEKKRIISILCHASYYPAQILIALSICFLALL